MFSGQYNVCSIFILALVLFNGETSLARDNVLYQNTADFVCGANNEQSQDHFLNNVEITFYNSNDFPVMLNNFLSLEVGEGFKTPEYDKRYLNVLLDPKRGFSIDCAYINGLFYEDLPEIKIMPKNFVGNIHSKNIYPIEITMNYKTTSGEDVFDFDSSKITIIEQY